MVLPILVLGGRSTQRDKRKMTKLEDLDHPCRQTCSGWQQGRERGQAEVQKKLDKAVEALEWYAGWDWSDKYVQRINKRARAALKEISE